MCFSLWFFIGVILFVWVENVHESKEGKKMGPLSIFFALDTVLPTFLPVGLDKFIDGVIIT